MKQVASQVLRSIWQNLKMKWTTPILANCKIGRALEDVMQEKTALEEENRKLREVYNSAKRLISNCVCDRDECENTCANCSFYLLEQALAALDGGEKPQTVIVDEDDGYCD